MKFKNKINRMIQVRILDQTVKINLIKTEKIQINYN
jgi:hypothetical protein